MVRWLDYEQTSSMSWRLGVKTAPEKPRWIIVGIQTNKASQQDKNAALFDHINVKNMAVVLNNNKYPLLNANADFGKYEFTQFYKAAMDFKRNYYGADPLITSACISPSAFHDLTPLFVFDLTKQSERLDTGVVDITVDMQFSANAPAQTYTYALVISNRKLKLSSDGKKINVLY